MSDRIVEIQITCGDAAESDAISAGLVDQRLAACVQQVPITSVYRWEGRVERDDEILLLVKTVASRLDDVRRFVRERHSYDVPAVTVVEVVDGTDDYLDWVRAETT